MNEKPIFTIALLSAAMLLSSSFTQAGETPEDRLEALGITLPEVSPSIANYVGAVQTGNLLFLSGHIPRDAEGAFLTGRLGDNMDVEAGYEAARLAGIALLATLKDHLGDLDRVKRVVKVFGMVNATPEFTSHSQVINGCSDLMVKVFGEKGRHARAASGFSSLPVGACVEIEMIVEIE
jgi:enamine deaminase RidA (YjgF/YER057c/UK114 family)